MVPVYRYVLDTSAILARKMNISSPEYVTTQSVMNEIRLGKIARLTDYSSGILAVMEPKPESVERVRMAASRTGDLAELSPTDIDVVALALDLNIGLISDDYAIQNVSRFLGIGTSGADLKEIGKEITWKYRCTGCGKVYARNVGNCSVCGHSLKRAVKSYKIVK